MTASEPDPAGDEPRGIIVLDVDTCTALLESTPIGRVAFNHKNRLSVFPVNYAWSNDSVVFRTITGEKLSAAREFSDVAFEVDEWDARSRTGWSVFGEGSGRTRDGMVRGRTARRTRARSLDK